MDMAKCRKLRGECARGGGEYLGLTKVKFDRSPLWMLLYWNDPPNSFWWLSRSPPVVIFQSNFCGPPLYSSGILSVPPFFLPKIFPPPPPPSDKSWPVPYDIAFQWVCLSMYTRNKVSYQSTQLCFPFFGQAPTTWPANNGLLMRNVNQLCLAANNILLLRK